MQNISSVFTYCVEIQIDDSQHFLLHVDLAWTLDVGYNFVHTWQRLYAPIITTIFLWSPYT